MTATTCWLLEKVKKSPNEELQYYIRYERPIDGGRADLHTTNPDPHQAKKFASEKEANDYAEFYMLADQLRAQEYIFDDGVPS
jgi:hypothetical protein